MGVHWTRGQGLTLEDRKKNGSLEWKRQSRMARKKAMLRYAWLLQKVCWHKGVKLKLYEASGGPLTSIGSVGNKLEVGKAYP